MCGISCLISPISSNSAGKSALEVRLRSALERRGPDSFQVITKSVNSTQLVFLVGVLHIQGSEAALQPLEDASSNIFCWNGEVFGGYDLEPGISDTEHMFTLLNRVCFDSNSLEGQDDRIIKVLSNVMGPYAFIFYCNATQSLYYGRDPFGRRSLVQHNETCGVTSISSVAPDLLSRESLVADADDIDEKNESTFQSALGWTEVDTQGIYRINLDNSQLNSLPVLIPWPSNRIRLGRHSKERSQSPVNIGTQSDQPSDPNAPPCVRISTADRQQLAQCFILKLQAAITRRLDRMFLPLVSDTTTSSESSLHSKVGVLFSGGIDSVLISAVLGKCIELRSSNRVSVDLINISFYDQAETNSSSPGHPCNGDPSPDRLAAISAAADLKRLIPSIEWRLVHIDVTSAERSLNESHIVSLIYPSNTHMDLNIGTAFWFATKGVGYLRQYSTAEEENVLGIKYKNTNRPLLRVGDQGAASAVGRSVDSLYITKKKNPLPSSEKLVCRNSSGCLLISKEKCVFGLCKKCCIIKQRSANVELDGVEQNLDCPVHKLRNGKAEHLDVSLDRQGLDETELKESSDKKTYEFDFVPYTSECKAYLVGIGADEQLAGYGRHRTTFLKGGKRALEAELNMDINRLWRRNLGRDDRCISDNGVEAWFPFLDEEVVEYIQSLSIEQICDLTEGQGVGDKRILRDAAAIIGISSHCHQLVKRAIQFGTRIAKQTNAAYHGSHRKGKGDTKL